MTLLAYGCIEQQPDGRWICQQASTIQGRFGPIAVLLNQVFTPRSSFAGFGDFTAHLTDIAVERPVRPPHEWT